MAIAGRIKSFLDGRRLAYALVSPPAGETLAEAVLLRDEAGYLLAVFPAGKPLDLESFARAHGRPLERASARELEAIFPDCDPLALPPFGAAYGIPTALDDALVGRERVDFWTGKRELVGRMRGSDFAAACGHETRHRKRNFADDRTNVFSLRSFGAGLRSQSEYERNGHAGMLLAKSPELRVVLEAMAPDTALRTHAVHGPTTLCVLEGALQVVTPAGELAVGAGDMALLAREERREIRAPVESLFLMALGRTARAGEVPRRGATRARRVLVVANQTAGGAHLQKAVRERMAQGPCEFFVLVPAAEARPSNTTWEESVQREEAGERLNRALARLRAQGATARGVVGDFYPVRAIHDLLLVEKDEFDEILISTFPLGVSEWLKLDLPSRVTRRFGIPVTHIVAEE